MDKKEVFRKKLLATFKVEAQEHLSAISDGLIKLEKNPPDDSQARIIEKVFRAAHSLKGAARAVNLSDVEAACQAFESIFAAMKRGEIAALPDFFDTLHHALDRLTAFLSSSDFEEGEGKRLQTGDLASILRAALEGALLNKPAAPRGSCGDALPSGGEPAESEASHPEAMMRPSSAGAAHPIKDTRPELPVPASSAPDTSPRHPVDKTMGTQSPVSDKREFSETVRMPTARLDTLLLQAEEMLLTKLAGRRRIAELREIHQAIATWRREWNRTYPDVRKLLNVFEKPGNNGSGQVYAKASRLVGILDRNGVFLRDQESSLFSLLRTAEYDQRAFSGLLDHQLEGMKKALMLPLSSFLDVLPKIVRELSRDQEKDVELVIRQEEIEIGRRILEEMKDPLIHLVRNCIDHGIERPEERTSKSKPSRGVISITVSSKDGNKVEITIADDGTGIDVEKVRDAALKADIISTEEDARMNEQERMLLIFESGVSTNSTITDISGRGLGLAIVRDKVESLGGAISLESRRDIGTAFRMILPLSMATFRGVLVRVQDYFFILPTISIERVLRVSKTEIETVENKKTVRVHGKTVPLVQLADVLEINRRDIPANATDRVQVIVLSSADRCIAFAVDEILHEQEVLVKGLGSQLSRVRNIAGAAVLGNGKVAPVLNVPDLMKSTMKAASRKDATVPAPEMTGIEKKSILVAEDSITARVLLRSILEAAGYQVKTAVDGMDALTLLRTEDFDMVVSDVDMPRMNGFELTARIRAEKRLAELPVVLVTALESREDREHGIEVGASGYMAKSGFDQGDLLEVIRRLI